VSPRSILVLITSGLIAVVVGGAIVVSSAASGSPSVVPPPAVVPAQPATTLHLPTTLRLISQIDGQAKLDSIHQLVNEALSRPGTRKLIGTSALSCTGVRGTAPKEVCNGALAFRDGAMLIQETLDVGSGNVSGRVLGGSGSYTGAQGDITGQEKNGGMTALTVNYSLG
jgi:hypothetical protein